MKNILLLWLAFMAGTSNADAARFLFAQNYDRGTDRITERGGIRIAVGGTFEGELANGLVTNISNVTLTFNGRAVATPLFAVGLDPSGASYSRGSARISLNGLNNNVILSTVADPAVAVPDIFLLSFTGVGRDNPDSVNDGPLHAVNDAPGDDRLRVMRDGAAGTVPEPAGWAMMIVGFGAAGGVLRHRRPPARRIA